MILDSKKGSRANPSTIDKVGACASLVCAIHCVLTGAAMGLLAATGLHFLANPWIEGAFVSVALIVGTVALAHGIRKHHSYVPSFVFVFGLLCIVASHFAGHDGDNQMFGTILAVAGGLSIALFHWLNARMQHRRCTCNSADRQL